MFINPSTWETRRLCLWGLPGLHSEVVKNKPKAKPSCPGKVTPAKFFLGKMAMPCHPHGLSEASLSSLVKVDWRRDQLLSWSCSVKDRVGASNEGKMCKQQTERPLEKQGLDAVWSLKWKEAIYKLPTRLEVPSSKVILEILPPSLWGIAIKPHYQWPSAILNLWLEHRGVGYSLEMSIFLPQGRIVSGKWLFSQGLCF